MDEKLDKALVRDFPILFGDRYEDMRQTAMCWGFPGNGWEPLIRELAEKLEEYNNTHIGNVVATQVKEKFGGLRFYVFFTEGVTREDSGKMWELIGKAELKSEKTCEYCGAPGKLRESGWVKTRCDKCQAAWEKENITRSI